MAKHREANQTGDRIKILKAGQGAMAKLATKAGVPQAKIQQAQGK